MRIFLESMYIFLYSSIQQAVYRVTLYFSHRLFLFAHSHSNDQLYKPTAIEQ